MKALTTALLTFLAIFVNSGTSHATVYKRTLQQQPTDQEQDATAPKKKARPAAQEELTLCPNGKYVRGDSCNVCPDGSYVGHEGCELAPDGTYH